MEQMKQLVNIVVFCAYFGIMILSILLIIYSILSWINDSNTKNKKLTILSWIAFVILLFMFSHYYVKNIAGTYGDESGVVSTEQLSSEQNDSRITEIELFSEVAKTLIKELINIVIFASVIILLFIIIIGIYHGLHTIIRGKKATEDQVSEFLNAVKQPIVIKVITLAIVSFFFVLPILVGEHQEGNLVETWNDGIVKVNNFFEFNLNEDQEETQIKFQENAKENTAIVEPNNNESSELVTYILFYIIVMGVGFAVVKLLYSVLERILLKEEKEDLIDKYSSPIALLSVGVAFLLAFKKGRISGETRIEKIGELLKAFGTVIFIIAIVILTLEIIRLLMDIRQKLIRDEAKYLFISLVGQSALLLHGVLNSIYSAVNSMFSNAEDTDLDKVEAELRKKIVSKMREQMKDDGDKDYETSFSGFDEKVTKK